MGGVVRSAGSARAAIRAGQTSLLLRDRDAEHLDRLIGAWLTDRHAAGWGHVALAGNAHRTSFNL